MSKKRPKKIFQQKTPFSRKQLTIASQKREAIESTLENFPVWQFSILDFIHKKWGWKNFKGQSLCRAVLKKLTSYESMTWQEIFNNKRRNHSVPIASLTPEAQKCIRELKLDDVDELYRLRLSGKERIWGILEGYVFKIIWWDPEHTVCPSFKKHT